MEESWIYIGIFLDKKSRKKLMNLYPQPEGWKEIYDHMTVVYNDSTNMAYAVRDINQHNLNKKFKLKIIGPGISDKAYALQVELPKGVVAANKITHITLATCPATNGNAVDSNYITNWSKIYDNIYVTGEMKIFKPTPGLLNSSEYTKIIVDEANIS